MPTRGGGSDGKDKGGDHRTAREAIDRAAPGVLGNGMGVGLYCDEALIGGVSIFQPLIGSFVECCSELASLSLYQ